jgi:hypothetical protein
MERNEAISKDKSLSWHVLDREKKYSSIKPEQNAEVVSFGVQIFPQNLAFAIPTRRSEKLREQPSLTALYREARSSFAGQGNLHHQAF